MATIDNLDKILLYFYNEVPSKKSLSEIVKVIFQDNRNIPVSELINHLIEEKYLFEELENIEYSTSKRLFGITVPGMRLFERIPKTNRPLYDLELEQMIQKEQKQKLIDNQIQNSSSEKWVKKYWWVMLIIGWVGGCFTDIAKEGIKKKLWTDSNKSSGRIIINDDSIRVANPRNKN